MSIEVMYNTDLLPRCDMFGILIYETKINGIINNFPLRRRAVPFQVLDLYQSNNRQIRFLVRDESLNAINLSGAVCVFSVKEKKSDASFSIQKSTDVPSEGQIGASDEGESFFYIVPSDTAALGIGQYWFDVRVTLSDGKTYTTVEGYLNLLDPIN